MGIFRVQCDAAGFASSASARVLATGSSVSAGNLILVAVSTYNLVTVSISDSLGNTYSQAGGYATQSPIRVSLWWAISASSGTATVTVTPSAAAYIDFSIAEYSGVATTSPLTATGSSNGSSTTMTPGAMSVATDGSLVVVGIATVIGSNPLTSGLMGISAFVNDNNSPVVFASTTASSGTITPTVVRNSAIWAACGAVFAPASAISGGGTSRLINGGLIRGQVL